jgi:hypothetical protein
VASLSVWLTVQTEDSAVSQGRTGSVLDGGLASQVDVQYFSLRIGQEYWVSLPQVTNSSSEPVTVTKARFVSLPHGLKLISYKAMSVEDSDGYPLGVTPIKGGDEDLTGFPDHSGKPFTVKARQSAKLYYVARVKVTGPVTGDTTQCRFWYQQHSVKYRQDLRCVDQLRLAKK